jgi:hypothetical protein
MNRRALLFGLVAAPFVRPPKSAPALADIDGVLAAAWDSHRITPNIIWVSNPGLRSRIYDVEAYADDVLAHYKPQATDQA